MSNEKLVPKLRFAYYTDTWKPTKISNIAEVVGGGTPRTEVEEYWDGNIKWFTPSEIGKSKFILDSERHITDEGLKNSSAKLLPKNTILLSSRATVGEISIALTECSTNQGFQSLIPKENYDTDFIYYLISTIKNEFLRRSSGSTFLEISKNEVKRIKINIPSISEQKQIGNFFSAIDNKIELLKKKHQDYQEFKKYLLQNIFLQKLRFASFEDEEWVTKKLEEVSIINPKTNELPDEFIYIDLESVNNGILTKRDKIEKNNAPSRAQRCLEINDILFQTVRPYQKNNLFFDFDDDIYVASTGYAQIRSKIYPKFLYYYLTFQSFVNNVLKRCTGTSYPAINSNDLKTIKIEIPPTKNEQKYIGDLFYNIDKKISLIQDQISYMENFKKGLLQQMFV